MWPERGTRFDIVSEEPMAISLLTGLTGIQSLSVQSSKKCSQILGPSPCSQDLLIGSTTSTCIWKWHMVYKYTKYHFEKTRMKGIELTVNTFSVKKSKHIYTLNVHYLVKTQNCVKHDTSKNERNISSFQFSSIQ